MAAEDSNGFPILTEDEVEKYRVADLKRELTARDLDFPKRAKKAELKSILLEYVQKNCVVAGKQISNVFFYTNGSFWCIENKFYF